MKSGIVLVAACLLLGAMVAVFIVGKSSKHYCNFEPKPPEVISGTSLECVDGKWKHVVIHL